MKKLLLLMLAYSLSMSAALHAKEEQTSPFKAKDYSSLIGMPGFSDAALRIHFKLYEGYVKNANAMIDLIEQLTKEGKDRSPLYGEIKRRFGWEFDGMRLHEYYFENLGGKGTIFDNESYLAKHIVKDFGSFEKWKNDFILTGSIRGIGWAVLYYDPTSKRLVNVWINEHDLGHLAGAEPILVMDVFEHAYLLDYGIDRAKYIEAFFDNVNWPLVARRYTENSKKIPTIE